MRQARIMMHAMLVSLVTVVWLTSGLSLATEPRAVTPALAPAPAPPNHARQRMSRNPRGKGILPPVREPY